MKYGKTQKPRAAIFRQPRMSDGVRQPQLPLNLTYNGTGGICLSSLLRVGVLDFVGVCQVQALILIN